MSATKHSPQIVYYNRMFTLKNIVQTKTTPTSALGFNVFEVASYVTTNKKKKILSDMHKICIIYTYICICGTRRRVGKLILNLCIKSDQNITKYSALKLHKHQSSKHTREMYDVMRIMSQLCLNCA